MLLGSPIIANGASGRCVGSTAEPSVHFFPFSEGTPFTSCTPALDREEACEIGFSNNLQRRVQELIRDHGMIEVVHLIDSDTTEATTYRLEQALHFHYRAHHQWGEWFTEAVLDTMKTLNLAEVRRNFEDSKLVEIQLPKRLAALDIEAVLEAHIKPGDSKALSLPSTDSP